MTESAHRCAEHSGSMQMLARQELDDWVAGGNTIAPYVEGE